MRNDVILTDSTELQIHALSTFMYRLGYVMHRQCIGVPFDSTLSCNKRNKTISFANAVSLYNAVHGMNYNFDEMLIERHEPNGFITITLNSKPTYTFSTYLLRQALESRILESIDLHLKKRITIESNKKLVKFINDSEVLYAHAIKKPLVRSAKAA